MSKLPAVDLVVLNLDRHDDIHACIDSILEQDYSDIRIWVIDQGSQPDTVESLRQRAGEIHLRESGLIGIARGRNLGYRLGDAPIIISLDNDAVFGDSGSVRRAVACFDGQDRLGVVGFAVHNFHTGGPDMSCWIYPWPAESHFEKSFSAARFCGGAHAIRRTAFEDAGGYDEELFFFGEELDLAYALVARGYRIQYDPDIVVRHKASGEGRIDWDSGRLYHNARNMLYLNRKHFGSTRMQMQYAAGYLVKGLINGAPADAWRGVRDGFRLARSCPEPPLLKGRAREYVKEVEFSPRGNVWQRFCREAAMRLNSTGAK